MAGTLGRGADWKSILQDALKQASLWCVSADGKETKWNVSGAHCGQQTSLSEAICPGEGAPASGSQRAEDKH